MLRASFLLLLCVACASTRETTPVDDEFSMERALPRSGDPARPNVKVELGVVDISSRAGVRIETTLAGGVVRGVVDLAAVVAAGAEDGRARSRTASFIVVQAGSTGSIMMSEQAQVLAGPYTGLQVTVLRASSDEVELALAPFASTTSIPGEQLEGATQVTVRAGQALVLGGTSRQVQRRSGGLGGWSQEDSRRETLVLLMVHVLG
ncbi:MAG: hypothetical protein AB2A00_29260 [Myxococcota bacterium]